MNEPKQTLHWTKDELEYLKQCYTDKYPGGTSLWFNVSVAVNIRFHNCRTPESCRARYSRIGIRERTGYDKTEMQQKRR